MVSCETTNNSKEEVGFDKLETLLNAKIGTFENGKVEITVSERSILSAAQLHAVKTGVDFKPESYAIQTLNDKLYLRVFGKDNMTTTVGLAVESSGKSSFLRTLDVSCTSTGCRDNDCIPDGINCTSCTKTCTRTVSDTLIQ